MSVGFVISASMTSRSASSIANIAMLRVVREGKSGPARELHAGSGYWSQDSAVTVLAGPFPAKIEVRWPGGKITTAEVPAGAKEITVEDSGTMKVKGR